MSQNKNREFDQVMSYLLITFNGQVMYFKKLCLSLIFWSGTHNCCERVVKSLKHISYLKCIVNPFLKSYKVSLNVPTLKKYSNNA